MSNAKKKNKLKKRYDKFIKTEEGKKWMTGWKKSTQSDVAGDFGDYLYDFYPEMLQ